MLQCLPDEVLYLLLDNRILKAQEEVVEDSVALEVTAGVGVEDLKKLFVDMLATLALVELVLCKRY